MSVWTVCVLYMYLSMIGGVFSDFDSQCYCVWQASKDSAKACYCGFERGSAAISPRLELTCGLNTGSV